MKKEAVNVEETKAVIAEPAAAEKKEANAKKPAAKTAETKSTSKRKPGRPPKKADEKTATQAVLEYQGNAIEVDKIEEKVKAQFVAEGHRAGNIKDLKIYIKPEDGKAYYVINGGKFDGKVDLF